MPYHQFSLLQRKAAKPHRCIWCGEAILPGEVYEEQRGIFEGKHQLNRWHLECSAAFSEDVAQGGDTEFIPYSYERPT